MTRLTEAYDRGRADERAAVVAWLRERDAATGAAGFAFAAERVAAEDHLAGGPYRQHVWDGDCWCGLRVKP